MFPNTSKFSKRVTVFRRELERGTYPNAVTLAELTGCSQSSAQRVIDRLRNEYSLPIKYDSSEKGYYLSDPATEFDVLPPGKDELTALLLMRNLANGLGDPELKSGISHLWLQYLKTNSSATLELEELTKHFSSESTEVAVLADNGVITYLNLAAKGAGVELGYQSPWRHQHEQAYRGRVEHVHLANGTPYLLFREENGNERVLNSSFVSWLNVLNDELVIQHGSPQSLKATNWLEGFGVWSGGPLYEVEISILPPASRYYARQRWDETQEDVFEGEVLVRKMQSLLSPELVRKILGLGHFVADVKPPELKHLVLADAKALVEALG